MKDWREGWRKWDTVYVCDEGFLYMGRVSKLEKHDGVLWIDIRRLSITGLSGVEWHCGYISHLASECGRTPEEAVEIVCSELRKLLEVVE